MQEEDFQVLDVTSWEVDDDETGGAEEKLWLRDPESSLKWLFKPVTLKEGHRHGEDWAEKASSHLAQALSVPCATVELATRRDRSGTISLNLRPDIYDMQPGTLIMLAHPIPDYRPGNVPGRLGHSVLNIRKVLDGMLAPPACDLPSGFTAFDTFCGYMVLDAWIANRDRHDENWSVLIPRTPHAPSRLCGSYDQANSLGYNLREAERERRLAGRDGGVQRWAERGTAWRLEHDPSGKPMTLVEAAAEALNLADRPARAYWLDRLESLDPDVGPRVLQRLPGMSDPARNFANTLLDINRRRLLDECSRPTPRAR